MVGEREREKESSSNKLKPKNRTCARRFLLRLLSLSFAGSRNVVRPNATFYSPTRALSLPCKSFNHDPLILHDDGVSPGKRSVPSDADDVGPTTRSGLPKNVFRPVTIHIIDIQRASTLLDSFILIGDGTTGRCRTWEVKIQVDVTSKIPCQRERQESNAGAHAIDALVPRRTAIPTQSTVT